MFSPLKIRSHYSLSLNPSSKLLLQSLNRPNMLVEACVVNGYTSFGLSDIGSVSGSVSVMKACKSVCVCGKQKDEHFEGKGKCRYKNGCEEYLPFKIKPMIGCDFFVQENMGGWTNLNVIAPNIKGWQSLMRLTSLANSPERFSQKPNLKLGDFKDSGLICITGQAWSLLANSLFENSALAYVCDNYDCVKGLVKKDWEAAACKVLDDHLQIFGSGNFYLGINFQDASIFPALSLISKVMRYLGKKHNIKVVADTDCFYPKKTDAPDHRLVVCSNLDTTLADVKAKIDKSPNLNNQARFFSSNNYYLPSLEEVKSLYEESELKTSLEISERCESYNILNKPQIPNFCEQNGDELLHKLCREGWKEKFANKIPKSEWAKYGDRTKMELEVFKNAGLANYFLIVQDYCKYATEKFGALMSPSRGSCGGSLVACLLGITDASMDPVKNNLFFERFYNAGRNTKDKISLPDIDSDFPISVRPLVIEYIRNKYGADKVSQMSTFGKLQGKGALKEVLRVHNACNFNERNKISECIQDPSKIAGDLQEKREEEGDASSIAWSLENTPEILKEWVEYKDGQFTGQFAKQFEQAIRLEGIYKSQGKHASGLLISSVSLPENLPMIHDKEDTGLQVAGFEMGDLEAMGYVKFDILGLRLLDKLMDVQKLLLSEDGSIE